MRTSKFTKSTLAAASAFIAIMAANPAAAQEIEGSGITISGSAALTTDYRFRGVSLSGGDIAVQGSINLNHDSGFYTGVWASSLEGKLNPYGGTEVDVYAGWAGEVASGVSVDVSLVYYVYPNGVAGADLNYFEPIVKVSGTLGPVDVTVGGSYSWKQDSLGGDDNLYGWVDLAAAIPDTPLTLKAHLGYTDGALAPPLLAGLADDTGLDWALGADYAVTDNLTFGVQYSGVEGPSIDSFTDDAIVATLTFAF
jgi:uncharacterized protein (TIGR02001 family)